MWLDVFFVWKRVPDELYEVVAAGWNHFLFVPTSSSHFIQLIRQLGLHIKCNILSQVLC
jgi:hypothetical protein